MRYRSVTPPFWWRPWLYLYYPVREWWYRPRPVKISDEKDGKP